MTEQQLQERLEQLHAELKKVESVDQDDRRLLLQLSADIQELLEPGAAHHQNAYVELAEQLREGMDRLEATHPQLTMLMAQMADVLARMGI